MTTPIVVEGLTKRFGSFAAVDDLSFTAREGAITALLDGASGAAVSTIEAKKTPGAMIMGSAVTPGGRFRASMVTGSLKPRRRQHRISTRSRPP